MKRRGMAAITAMVVAGSLAAGCGLNTSYQLPFEVEPASIEPVPELDGLSITVGSKNFTENVLLGYLAGVALAAAGAEINDLTNIQGSDSNRKALQNGDIDLYWEYTGTSWIGYQGNTDPIPDEQQQYDAVKKVDEEQFGISWLDYSPVNNTYAFATTREFAERNNLTTLTDLAEFLNQNPSKGVFCLDAEFISRQDGLPGVEKKYGFRVGTTKTFALGTIYDAVDKGTCEFGEVFTTDARILTLDLAVLEDDQKFFPQYNAAVTLRTEFLDRYPRIREVLEPISRKLDNETIQLLSVEIDHKGVDPAVVARDWLAKEGFVKAAST